MRRSSSRRADALRGGALYPNISLADAAGYCRRLSVFLASGALPEALLSAAEGAPRRVMQRAERLRRRVLAGELLSQAFAAEKFPRTAVSFLLLAEETGSYPHCLALAAEELETRLRLRENTRGILLYPILLCIGLLVFFLLFAAFVFPAFAEAFASLGLALPPLTAALLSAGEWLLENLALLLAVAAALALLLLSVSRISAVRLHLDAFRLRFRAERCQNALLFCRSLSLLAEGGAQLPQAVAAAAELLPNARAAQGVKRAADAFSAGEPLARALRREKIFPAFLLALIAAGEETDSLGALTKSALPALERERTAALRLRANLLRTLLLCLAAAEIVLLFAALYAPILTLLAIA